MKDFCHLHVHSDYSLQDGVSKIPDIVDEVVKHGMKSLALTDHGYLSGVVEFYKACKSRDVKPIFGVETYLSPTTIDDKTPENKESYHLILLARNLVGYKNLIKLMTIAATDGFYRQPRVDKALLAEYSEGLICSTACLQSPVNVHLYDSKNGKRVVNLNRARAEMDDLRQIFGQDHLFAELMYHGLESQKQVAKNVLKIAKDMSLKCIVTNDSHYATSDKQDLRDIMMADRCNMTVDDPNRVLKDAEGEYYIKSPQQMWDLWEKFGPELLTNTLEIANSVELFDPGTEEGHRLPKFTSSEEESRNIFGQKVSDGFKQRYPEKDKKSLEWARVNYELSVIDRLEFRDYFLILADIISEAEKRKIAIGPGRGSAAGSIVAYCLGITTVCPIEYGLLFERFLNPERKSLPDIDVDVCQSRRQELIGYITEKYGQESVAQIITFGRVKGRGSIRLVGKALGIPFEEYDQLSKKMPKDAAEYTATLEEVLNDDPDSPIVARRVVRKYLSEGDIEKRREFLESCVRLEFTNKSHGVHAGAVVIGPEPLKNIIPLKLGKDGNVTTQVGMEDVEELGLLKLDLLGLDTLTFISNALRMISEDNPDGPLKDKTDIYTLRDLQREIPNMDDPAVYKNVFNIGRAIGTFQCESSGIREILARMEANKFSDLAAAISLYRPGPLDSGITDSFISRRRRRESEESWHPEFDEHVAETHLLPIYQEQIMKASQVLCGYNMAEADKLRKVIGKKKKEEIEEFREKFVTDAVAYGKVNEERATYIYNQIEKYGRYCFNKSHAIAYAVITYYTGWLKYYYPAYAMSSLLNKFCATEQIARDNSTKAKILKKKNDDKLAQYIWEARKLGISVRSPNIQESSYFFTPKIIDGQSSIIYGIGSLRSVGVKAQQLIEWRERNGGFKNAGHWLFGLIQCGLNKTVAKQMISSGCIDFGMNQQKLYEVVDGFIRPCACTKSTAKTKTPDCKRCNGTGLGKTKKSILEDVKKVAKNYDQVTNTMVEELDEIFDSIEGIRTSKPKSVEELDSPPAYSTRIRISL